MCTYFVSCTSNTTKKNIWNKLTKTIAVLFSFSMISCASIKKYKIEKKEQNTQRFFNQWHTETQQILAKNKAKGKFQKSINKILTLLSKDEKTDSQQLFPKLEYQILEETIKVSMYKKLGQTLSEQDLIFSEVNFKHSLNYGNSDKKILIFTPRYQKVLQKSYPTDLLTKLKNKIKMLGQY